MADWVVDSLVGFLKSPMWKYPVDSFIEQNCVVFDPGDENKFSYTDIHMEYKRLVESVLENFMDDLGLTAEQLAGACTQSGKLGKENEKLFEQILAAEDFIIFKSMMVQKNIDIELQALTVLQKQLGHSPVAYKYGESDDTCPERDRRSDEDDVLDKVLMQSKAEYDLQRSLDEEELQRLLTMAKEESLRLHEVSQKEQQNLADSLTRVVQLSDNETYSKKVEISQKSDSRSKHHEDDKLTVLPPVKPPPSAQKQQPLQDVISPRKASSTSNPSGDVSGSEAASAWLQNAKSDLEAEMSTRTQKVTVQVPNDLKAREAYLRRQRDRLLEMKRKTRAEEFDAFTASSQSSAAAVAAAAAGLRPKPAQVACSVAEGSVVERERERSSLSPRRKGDSSTGVLCSAITGKLKKELEQP